MSIVGKEIVLWTTSDEVGDEHVAFIWCDGAKNDAVYSAMDGSRKLLRVMVRVLSVETEYDFSKEVRA